MRGDISDAQIDSALTGTAGAPILIPRTELARARELLKTGAHLAITSEFGNGKSVFLRSLRSQLAVESITVYTADDTDYHQHDDLEKLIAAGNKLVLFIDSYDQNPRLASHFAELNPSNIQLVVAARTNNHERLRAELAQKGLKFAELSVDELDAPEISEFIAIVDNVGYWGDRAALPPHVKTSIISHDNKRELSLNLLSLLSAPQMVARLRDLLSGLLENPRQRDTVFAIALLASLDMPLDTGLIREVALNDEIYSGALRGDAKFREIFRLDASKVTTKSSIFATVLISHQFQASYIVDQMLKIVASIGNAWEESREKREIQKSLLRFSVVERLLPERRKKENLVRYYEAVKREVTWLKNDPHFWLQYGMTRLTFKEYDKAANYFAQAYSLAANKHDYHTAHIDTQQARLHLLLCIQESDPGAAYRQFISAHQLLRKAPIDVHKFRQVSLYKDVYEQHYAKFTGSARAYFEQACKAMLADLTAVIQSWNFSQGHSRVPERVKQTVETILDDVKKTRGQH